MISGLSIYECDHLINLLHEDAQFAMEDQDFDRVLLDLNLAKDFDVFRAELAAGIDAGFDNDLPF